MENKNFFSIRKLSIGVGSCLIAKFFTCKHAKFC
ncbi:YSIRK-type signal peptide-containing protein [Staphylococcus pseudintermedius]